MEGSCVEFSGGLAGRSVAGTTTSGWSPQQQSLQSTRTVL